MISVIICTHNRSGYLKQCLDSLLTARQSTLGRVEIIVAANGCTDDTCELLSSYQRDYGFISPLIMERPGKSRALNQALNRVNGTVTAIVDDDHVVDTSYLRNIEQCLEKYEDTAVFCGRVKPLWTGDEPDWVHDNGPFAIRPFPVPDFDLGPETVAIERSGSIPGCGNLVLRRKILDRTGLFNQRLGPLGHNLAGGEDIDFILRMLDGGEKVLYIPDILQYHQVDPSHLHLSFMTRKSYQRNKVLQQLRLPADRGSPVKAPRYLYRKLLLNLFFTVFTLDTARRRYSIVNTGGVLGQIAAFRDTGRGS